MGSLAGVLVGLVSHLVEVRRTIRDQVTGGILLICQYWQLECATLVNNLGLFKYKNSRVNIGFSVFL